MQRLFYGKRLVAILNYSKHSVKIMDSTHKLPSYNKELNLNSDYSCITDEITETPLQTAWTLWLDKTTTGSSISEYESNLKKVYTFKTIEGFWAVYNNVPDVQDIQTGYSYHLMREEHRPVWEESYNQKGGIWRFRCNKNDTSKVWKELVLAAIGEQFLDSLSVNDEICGLTVSVREKFDIIKLWNSNAKEASKGVIDKVYKLLPDVVFAEPLYKEHQTHSAFRNC